jgi:hypothetical protein
MIFLFADMRWMFVVVVIVALGVGFGSYAYASWSLLGKHAVGIDFSVEPQPVGKLAIGLNADTDAVHLGSLHPGTGCTTRDVSVTNRYDVRAGIVFVVDGLPEWVSASPSAFVLEPGKIATTTVSACPPVGTPYGNQTGALVAIFRRK